LYTRAELMRVARELFADGGYTGVGTPPLLALLGGLRK